MKWYSKLKVYIRLSLLFSILLNIFIAFEAITQSNLYCLFLSCAVFFVVIIPLYYVSYILEKQKYYFDESTKKVFNIIGKMIKAEPSDFDNTIDREILNDKNLVYYYEHIVKNKKMFYELKQKDKLLNEILISAVVNMETDKLLQDIMPKIMDITQSQFIVFYTVNKSTNKLEIKSSIGFGKSIYSQFDLSMGEGFLGRAAVTNKIIVVKELDNDSIYVTKTFLGDVMPKNIIAVPINDVDDENNILGVFAIGSVYEYTDNHIEILEEIRKYTSYAILNGIFYNKNIRLTNELKFQNQLIQNLNEDLEMKIKERTGILNNVLNSIKSYSIISMDNNNRIVMINNVAATMFKIFKDEYIGKSISEIPEISTYLDDKTMNYVEMALKTGKVNFIKHIKNSRGKELIFEIEIFVVKNEFDDVTGTTVILKDITYMKRMETSEIVEKKLIDLMLEESYNSIIVVKDDFTVEGISKNAEYLIGYDINKAYGMNIGDLFVNSNDVKNFIKDVFEGSAKKTFGTTATITKIDINMKAKLISDDSCTSKKLVLYM